MLKHLGMKVLRDEYELVDSSFYVIGREDVSDEINLPAKHRKTLEQIINSIRF
ncbi:MAG: hypothetical protein MZV64_73815 [Ignavibacteriales bacterium]|nr:hypothetical protein [Ignavibacteriales bacterium]